MKPKEIKRLLRILDSNNLFVCKRHKDIGEDAEYEPLLFNELIKLLENED